MINEVSAESWQSWQSWHVLLLRWHWDSWNSSPAKNSHKQSRVKNNETAGCKYWRRNIWDPITQYLHLHCHCILCSNPLEWQPPEEIHWCWSCHTSLLSPAPHKDLHNSLHFIVLSSLIWVRNWPFVWFLLLTWSCLTNKEGGIISSSPAADCAQLIYKESYKRPSKVGSKTRANINHETISVQVLQSM